MTTDLSQHDLIAGFAHIGARPDCSLMVHASLSKFGHVAGGAQAVAAALRSAAGSGGAVIMPSFRDAIRSPHFGLNECQADCPQSVCPSKEHGYTGAIGEALREQTDSLRSCHPTHSWVGLGGGASFLLEGHGRSLTPCGAESPFFRLMERDGTVLLLGVGVNSITNVHAVEDARNVPYLSAIDPLRRHATYTTSGRRIQYVYPELLQTTFAECGLLRTTQVGAATCHAIRARDLGSFLWVATDDDPWCLVLRPMGGVYEPFIDAIHKTKRMTEAWRSRPDQSAWLQLLAASQHETPPVPFTVSTAPATECPAYRGVCRGHHRCAANDVPPWEKMEDYPLNESGVATCDTCNWPHASVRPPN